MSWHPHVTVATIVEDQGRFLLVEEQADGREVLNQPAGHLEPAESLLEAALRETLEETGWEVELSAVTGIYLYTARPTASPTSAYASPPAPCATIPNAPSTTASSARAG